MFSFFRKIISGNRPIDYSAEWSLLRSQHADPAIELATTKQAVVVSAASVLDRIWNGNGGLGWDEGFESDYVVPLRIHLVQDDLFSEEEKSILSKKLDEIVAVGSENLRRIAAAGDEETVLESSVDVDFVIARVVEYCRAYKDPIPISEEEEYRGHH